MSPSLRKKNCIIRRLDQACCWHWSRVNYWFTWFNYRVIYCMVIWTAMIVYALITLESEQADNTPLSVLNERLLDVVGPSLFFFPIFFNISYKWRKFVHEWEATEKTLTAFKTTKSVKLKLKLTLLIFIGAGIGFILVTLILHFTVMTHCLQSPSFWDQFESYFIFYYKKIFRTTSPALWKYCVLIVMDIIITLQWASCNLLITVLSVILTAQFKQFNNHLQAFKTQLMPTKYWQDMRDSYSKLSKLTMLLDELLSPLVLVSFIMETLKIIVYIYDTISHEKCVLMYVLAFFRCPRVVLVNFITQFAIAAIYEESKRPLEVFNLVPSISFSREVKRLYEQVSTDTLALSGCQFFFVTRSVILTMMSTIVTYEVVLIQFGSYEPQVQHLNSSVPLYCRDFHPYTLNHSYHQHDNFQ